MAGKNFELEQVLKYRLEIERLRKEEFVTAKRELEHASDQLEQEEQQLQGIADEFCNRQKEMQSVEDMRRYADYFARKREEIKSQKERVEQLGQVMNDRRETLIDASKDKKVLETLKEKKATEFRQAMDLKEQAFMDEIAIQKKSEKS